MTDCKTKYIFQLRLIKLSWHGQFKDSFVINQPCVFSRIGRAVLLGNGVGEARLILIEAIQKWETASFEPSAFRTNYQRKGWLRLPPIAKHSDRAIAFIHIQV